MGALKDGLSPEIRNNITITEDNKIFFRDSGLYIHSSSDGVLNITTDGTSGNTLKIKLNDRAGLTNITVLDADDFPMAQLDSDGNLKQKGVVKKTLTG